jgi:hypothetical protein
LTPELIKKCQGSLRPATFELSNHVGADQGLISNRTRNQITEVARLLQESTGASDAAGQEERATELARFTVEGCR